MNSSFSDGAQFAWDGTSLELASTCTRKYYYRMIENIVPQTDSVHLIFGGIYASALEAFYKHRAKGDSIEEATRKVVRLALVQSWNHERAADGSRIPETGAPVIFESSAKTRYTLIRSIIWYLEEFADESEAAVTTHHLKDGTPAVELSFTLEFAPGLFYSGHLDRVVNFAGDLYWMDQKTSGQAVNSYFFEKFNPNNQFSGYTWAGQIVLESPVRSGIVDAAQIAAGFTRFSRGIITRTQDQLDEWHESSLEIIEHTRELTRKGKFPMNLTACGNYGGCPYRLLCAHSPKMRDHYIAGHYKTVAPWDPLVPR